LKKVLYTYRDKSKIIMYVDKVRFHYTKKNEGFLAQHRKLEIRYLSKMLKPNPNLKIICVINF
jgi:hypothetical protein